VYTTNDIPQSVTFVLYLLVLCHVTHSYLVYLFPMQLQQISNDQNSVLVHLRQTVA